ncbi:bifunctional diguanylate cyclase/phosphodiesterase [Vibrio sp. ED002]|uniref:putative bifunctional diguanylate cyclase/phosphodiesterase n=1 Tax=Vibrio sp. ED002 TaxID=2785123 RepID=UPI00200BD466|nr:bifunctional diguanylate cyclase/phosphodiesterase [Vibrio sp. ED002]UQA51383.1 bifunctional diguanylate cyclase/phosphodiesterase [Vibrio sp. ED002]
MSILIKLYLILLPTLLFFAMLVGFVTYNLATSHAKHMYLDKVEFDVNTALVAAEYEQLGLSLLSKEVGSSMHFLRYIQNSDDYTTFSLLEKRILRLLNQSDVNQFGQRNIYVIDPHFELTLSTLRSDPFEPLKMPDKVYDKVFDIYTSLLNKEKYFSEGFSYISFNGRLRYAYVTAIDPYLSPQDKRVKESKNRYILITDGPLVQLSNLISKYNNNHFIFSLEPSKSIEKKSREKFIIESIKNSDDKTHVTMTSEHFKSNIIINNQLFEKENQIIAIKIITVTSTSLFLIFIVIHLSIKNRLIKPLEKLLEDISIGGMRLRYFKRSSGKNEVDTLKNAYIDSLTELKFEAEFDQLTKLANRRSFIRYLEVRLNSSTTSNCYLVCWDIIDFKKINDLYGSKVGDNVLKNFSSILKDVLQLQQNETGFSNSDYSISRLGGNQFIAVIETIEGDKINDVIKEINDKLTGTAFLDYYGFKLSLATGIINFDTKNFISIWHRCIDATLHEAKFQSDGDSRIVFGEELMHALERQDTIEKRLIECCESNNFELRFMPIFNANTLSIDGAEVLIRCPALFDINAGPDEFITVAEKSNLISEIDIWVIKNAIKSLKTLKDRYKYQGTISINISAMELYNRNFSGNLKKIVEEYGIPASDVTIEITETSYVKSTNLTVKTIENIRAIGHKVSLDDFGTGYTAFNQLLHYPVDEMKIDKSFIDKIVTDQADRRMVDSMINLGHSCKTVVVAEGVETFEQYEYLRKINCDLIQGYYFSMPLTMQEFINFISDHKPDKFIKSLSKETVVAINNSKSKP